MEFKKKITSKKSDSSERSQPFTAVGEYVCKVTGLRYNPESEQYAESYFIDLEVVSGPADVGTLRYWSMFFNPNKYTTTKMDDGRQFTGKQKRTKDEEAVQINLAAVHGLAADDAGELADKYASMEDAFADTSKLGSLVNVVVRSSTAKRGPNAGKTYYNPELSPFKGTVAPAVPAAPKLGLPAGYTVHPENPAYAFNAAGDVKLISELVG